MRKDTPIIKLPKGTFFTGLNYTVRLGGYWFQRLREGQDILLLYFLEKNGEPKAHEVEAEVKHLSLTTIKEIPKSILLKEQDVGRDTVVGLFELLKKDHPDSLGGKSFHEAKDEVVTLIGFELKRPDKFDKGLFPYSTGGE